MIVSVVCVPGPTVVSQLASIQMLCLVVGSSEHKFNGGEGGGW